MSSSNHRRVPPQHQHPPYMSRHATDVSQCLMGFTIAKNPAEDALKPYIEAARWIPLSIHPFASVSTFLYAGLDDTREELEDPRFTADDIGMYDKVMKLVPTLHEVIIEFYEQPLQLQKLILSISSSSGAARQEDTASLKHEIVQYLMPDPTTETVVPPITRSGLKSARGFNHTITARLLCPRGKVSIFDADPIGFMARVSDGSVRIRASEWPSFLYDHNTAFDPEDEEKGLLKGYVLLRVFRHIFTGPSSALAGRRDATKPSKAQLHKLIATTGRTIAYAAVQARVALNSSERWGRYDNYFDHEALYNNIVALFEMEPDAPWVVDTLAWWDERVQLTPHLKKRRRNDEEPDSEDDSPVTRILEQRAARRQREDERARARAEEEEILLLGPGGHGQGEAEEIRAYYEGLARRHAEEDELRTRFEEEARREGVRLEEEARLEEERLELEEREARLEEAREEARLEEEREEARLEEEHRVALLEEERKKRFEGHTRDEDETHPAEEEEEDDAQRRKSHAASSRPRPRPRYGSNNATASSSGGGGGVSHEYNTRRQGRK